MSSQSFAHRAAIAGGALLVAATSFAAIGAPAMAAVAPAPVAQTTSAAVVANSNYTITGGTLTAVLNGNHQQVPTATLSGSISDGTMKLDLNNGTVDYFLLTNVTVTPNTITATGPAGNQMVFTGSNYVYNWSSTVQYPGLGNATVTITGLTLQPTA